MSGVIIRSVVNPPVTHLFRRPFIGTACFPPFITTQRPTLLRWTARRAMIYNNKSPRKTLKKKWLSYYGRKLTSQRCFLHLQLGSHKSLELDVSSCLGGVASHRHPGKDASNITNHHEFHEFETLTQRMYGSKVSSWLGKKLWNFPWFASIWYTHAASRWLVYTWLVCHYAIPLSWYRSPWYTWQNQHQNPPPT